MHLISMQYLYSCVYISVPFIVLLKFPILPVHCNNNNNNNDNDNDDDYYINFNNN